MIRELYIKNMDNFQLAKTEKVNDKTFLFSHAGVLPDWLDYRFPEVKRDNAEDICKALNDRRKDENFLLQLINEVTRTRGGWSLFASPVWADVTEHTAYWVNASLSIYEEKFALSEKIVQIFGHSQQKEDPIFRPHFNCLDCRRAFLLTDKGIIMEMEQKEEKE